MRACTSRPRGRGARRGGAATARGTGRGLQGGTESGPPARLGRQQRRQGVRPELAAQEGGQARRVGCGPRRRAGGRRRVIVQPAHGLQQPVEQAAVLGGRADDAPPQRLRAHQQRRGLRLRGCGRRLLRAGPNGVQRSMRVAGATARAAPAWLQPAIVDPPYRLHSSDALPSAGTNRPCRTAACHLGER